MPRPDSFDLTAIGYDPGEFPSDPDDCYFGVWRTINLANPSQAASFDMRADALGTEELLHHTSGVQSDCFSESICDQCVPADRGVSLASDGTLQYADVADIPIATSYSVGYRTRMYVKVPATYLPHQESYMIAEASGSTAAAIISGVENVAVDPSGSTDPSLIRYFDLQGRPLVTPIPGQPYLEVTPTSRRLRHK